MIGQHPEFFGLPELKLFCYPTIGELEASLPRWALDKGIGHRSPGLVRAVAQLCFGDQSPRSLEAALEWLAERRPWTGADVFDILQSLLFPRTAIEKSPENLEDAAALGRLAGAYPDARHVHLTRHPSTSIRSMQDHWCRTMPGYPVEDLATVCADTWLDAHRLILAFAASLGADRYLRVRAEDVLNDPCSQLARVAFWLGAADDDAIDAMRHPERSPFSGWAAAGSGVQGGNDPAFLTDPVPRPVALPPGLEPDLGIGEGALWSAVVEMADELGYRSGSDPGPSGRPSAPRWAIT